MHYCLMFKDYMYCFSFTGLAESMLQEVLPNLSAIKLSSKMVKRGCPKGAGMTMIGLPIKKQMKKCGPVALRLRSPMEKETSEYLNS